MAINFNNPTKTQQYDTGFLASVRAHQIALAKFLEGEAITNPVAGIKRLNNGLFEEYNGSSWVAKPLKYIPDTAPQSYGSKAIAGVSNGWAGIQFSSLGKKWTLMIGESGESGFYNVADGAWKWYFTADGALDQGTVPWGRVTGAPAINNWTPSSQAIGNTAAIRDPNGYLYASYLNQSSGPNENPPVSQIMVMNGTDTFLRKASLQHVINSGWIMQRHVDTWITSTDGIGRMYFGNAGSTYFRTGNVFSWQNSGGTEVMQVDASGTFTARNNIYAVGLIYGRGGGNGLGRITISTAAPSGGALGDLWLQY